MLIVMYRPSTNPSSRKPTYESVMACFRKHQAAAQWLQEVKFCGSEGLGYMGWNLLA